MSDVSDLEDRVRKAMDWAEQEADRHRRAVRGGGPDAAGELIKAYTYEAINRVLDQILQPTDPGQPG
jgi:hypothetical protein